MIAIPAFPKSPHRPRLPRSRFCCRSGQAKISATTPCNSQPHRSLPPGQTRCGDDPVVVRLPRSRFCRRSGKAEISATTPAFAGAGSHATVSHTRACRRARPGEAATQWWRGYRGAGFAAGAAKRKFRQQPRPSPGQAPMQQSATPEPATGPGPVRRRPGGGAVTAELVLPPERQNENFGNNPGLRRGRLPCNSQPHQSLPPGQTRCGDGPVVARLPRSWFCRRSGKTKISATTPCNSLPHQSLPPGQTGWGDDLVVARLPRSRFCRRSGKTKISATTPCNSLPHQSLPPGQTRCGGDPVVARLPRNRFCRRSGKTKFSATTPAFAGAGSHATVSQTRARCRWALPPGAGRGGWPGRATAR